MNSVRSDEAEREQRAEIFARAVRDEIMPLIERLGLGEYWRRHQRLLEIDRLPPQEIRELQRGALRETVVHAAATVPFYRRQLARLGIDPAEIRGAEDLARLPTIDKRTLVEHFPDRLTSEASDKSSWRYRSTSGTGHRVMSVSDHDARQWRYALHLRSLAIAGDYRIGRPQVLIRTQACTEVCAADGEEEFSALGNTALPIEGQWPPFGFARLTLQETLLPPLAARHEMAPSQLDTYLDEIERLAPDLLRGLPQYLLRLGRHLRRGGRRAPGVRRILLQDSLPTAEMKREIAEAFGCPVRETYGSSELGSLAAECEAGFLHLASSLFVVEVLDLDGRGVAPGELGILAVTALSNRAMPLIRYRLGDLGRSIESVCACGRSTPRLQIAGRVSEALRGTDRWIDPRQISAVIASVPGVEQFQVIERAADRLEIQAVAGPGVELDLPALGAALEALVGEGYRVKARRVRRIAPERSGKYALVKTLPRDFVPES